MNQMQTDEMDLCGVEVAEYRGETKANMYTRGLKHLSEYRAGNNWMWQHTMEAHGGVMGPNRGREDYGMELVACFKRTMDRQLDEATRISRVEDGRDGREIVLEGMIGQERVKVKKKVKIAYMQGKGEYYKPKNVRVEFCQL